MGLVKLENLDNELIRNAHMACIKNAMLTVQVLSSIAPHKTGNLRKSFKVEVKNKNCYLTGAAYWHFSEKGTRARKTNKKYNRGTHRGKHYIEQTLKRLQPAYEFNIKNIIK